MPQIKLTTWKLVNVGTNGRGVTTSPNGPSKTVEIATLADVKRELAAFAEGEAKETGKPWLAIASWCGKRGERKPTGYNPAEISGQLQVFVNPHLCEEK